MGTHLHHIDVDAKGDLLVGSASDTVIRLAVGSNGQVLTAASGESSGIKWASSVLFDSFTDVNNTDTAETDLYTNTLAAGQLASNGQKIIAEYAGTFVGDATSTQRLRGYFGGTLIFDTGALGVGVSTTNWDLYITIIRVSASVVRCSAALNTSFASLNAYAQYTEVTGLTLANTQIVKITGTAAGASGASNQITSKLGYIEFKPNA